jgi:hypothetical protein
VIAFADVISRRLGPVVQARTGPRGVATGNDAYDIRVVAFAGARPRTLLALQELFGIDSATAERILAGVPLIVRRAAPAEEAQGYARALEAIGAKVVLERPGAGPGTSMSPASAARIAPPRPPPPSAALRPAVPAAAFPDPRARAADDLPMPVMHVADSELEFDVLADSLSSRPEQYAGAASERPASEPPTAAGGAAGLRRPRAEEFELPADTYGGLIELDDAAPPTRPAPARSSLRTERVAGNVSGAAPMAKFGSATVANDVGTRAKDHPMSRAAMATRHDTRTSAQGSRSVPLLRVLCAVVIGVVGIWLDNSILYGNASWFSVIVHGLGLQQLLLGMQGLMR